MAKEIPKQDEMGFDEWIAALIAHGMTNEEILTYLDPDTREEDLVALVRHLMSRREDGLPCEDPYDSTVDTMTHVRRVRELIGQVRGELDERARDHDLCKLNPPEKEIFDEFTPKLKRSTYGSDEYRGFLKEMKVALDHHYAESRHHPEHFENGVSSMNLIDLIEMLADWKAASERHEDGNIYKSIMHNTARFGMSAWLVDCLLHTAEDLGWWNGLTGPVCKRCGSSLNPDGHCVDITCPFSDRAQDEEFTEG
jgi:hypothetical protein